MDSTMPPTFTPQRYPVYRASWSLVHGMWETLKSRLGVLEVVVEGCFNRYTRLM